MSRSHSSSRTTRSHSEQRLSYDEIKEMMVAAAEDMKRREERDKEKAASSAAGGASSVLTESKVVNLNHGSTAGTNKSSASASASLQSVEDVASAPAAMASRLSKLDRRSASCRESRSMQTRVDRVVAQESGRTAIAWNSRPPPIASATEKRRNRHADLNIVQEQDRYLAREDLEEEIAPEVQPPDSSVGTGSGTSGSSSDAVCRNDGERAAQMHAQSCRTTKPSFDFNALEAHGQSSTAASDKVRLADNLSRTQAWLDEAEDLTSPRQLQAHSTRSSNCCKPYSPEIKEEEEMEAEISMMMMSLERSALIEDQLPGRLSQSVRFIKPGTPFILPSKEQKNMSTSSFRAFSAKIAKKLGRLFFSGSASKSGTTAGNNIESSTTESPKLTRKNSRTSSLNFRKWLRKPAAGSKVASAAEPEPKPVQDQVPAEEENKDLAKGGSQLQLQPKGQHKGKENVEVRNNKSSPAPAAAPAFHRSLSRPTTDSSSTKPIGFSSRPSPLSSGSRARALDFLLWSRPQTATTLKLPGSQRISPQEYARSVLGWEHSLVQPLRSPVKQPSSSYFSATAHGEQQEPPITAKLDATTPAGQGTQSAIPSWLNKPEKDEDGKLIPPHSAAHAPSPLLTSERARRKVDLHSGEEQVAVLDLIDYAVFSSDEGSLSPDTPTTTTTSSSKSGAEMGAPGYGLQVELSDGISSCADPYQDQEEGSPCWSPVSQSQNQEETFLPWCMEASQTILPLTNNPFAESSKYAGTQPQGEIEMGSPLFDLALLQRDDCGVDFGSRAGRNEQRSSSGTAHVPPPDGTSPSPPGLGWEPRGLTAVSFYSPNPGKIDIPSSNTCEDGESLCLRRMSPRNI